MGSTAAKLQTTIPRDRLETHLDTCRRRRRWIPVVFPKAILLDPTKLRASLAVLVYAALRRETSPLPECGCWVPLGTLVGELDLLVQFVDLLK